MKTSTSEPRLGKPITPHPILGFWQIEADRQSGGPSATVFRDFTKTKTWKCPECGHPFEKSPDAGARVHAQGKSAIVWPDFLLSFELIVSARVASDLVANDVKGFIAHRIELHKIDSPKLQKAPAPEYFLMEVTGRVDIDRQRYDEGDGNLCPVCHEWSPRPGGKHRWGGKMHLPVPETWDGSDWLKFGNLSTGFHICTTRIVEMAREKEWRGVAFESLTPRPFFVNLASDNWLAEVETKARAEYPQLFSADKNGG